MFITKGDLTIALDTISRVELGNSGGNATTIIYWIIFSLKTVAGSSQSSYNGRLDIVPNEVRFDYGTNKLDRDAAYLRFVDKYSLEI